MAPRRGPPSSNASSPQDPLTQSSSSAPSPAFPLLPRATSPSSGFSQFLSKPSKWFNWNSSSPRASSAASEPRSSASSGRKPKISHPTDPRPIISSLQMDNYVASATRSVLDLSSTTPPTTLEMPMFHFPNSTSSPPSPSSGLGDLRNMAHRAWSKSADDLGKMCTGKLPPINTSFQEKITQYRNRTNSSASGFSTTSHSPAFSTNLRQPFPSIKTPSSSPPRASMDHHPGVSISVSAPLLDNEYPSGTGPFPAAHVHIRSHSFTPRLSSKLTPRFPPSPKRKGSASSDRDIERDRDGKADESSSSSTGGGPSAAVAGARAVFPFNLSAGNYKSSQQDLGAANSAVNNHSTARSPAMLAPPIVIAPGPEHDEGENAKRSSQIVYHTGFINRQSNAPPALHQSTGHFPHSSLTLSKGWKPFKLELKGSKLYFYKPPGDRTAALKDLFPTELVPSLEGEEENGVEENAVETGGNAIPRKTKDSTVGRKKRSYWGRKTHPDLVLSGSGGDEKINRGTFEALVHEAVFATKFRASSDSEAGGAVEERMGDWKYFASAVLLCLPPLAGQKKFENEFTRCCAYLVSGAGDDLKETERARVGWLADEYLRYQGCPADTGSWDDWRAETIPDLPSAMHRAVPSAIPNSVSMQALFVPSPQLGYGSPNLGTFSPRPDEGKMRSLVEALGVPHRIPSPSRVSLLDSPRVEQRPSHQNSPSSTNPQIPWVSLEREGLSRDVLFLLDPHFIARSLCSFHRDVLKQTPEDIVANLLIGSDGDSTATPDPSELQQPASSFKHLFGSEEHPHWLTRCLLLQILGADTSAVHNQALSSPINMFDDRGGAHSSRTHTRSEVIAVWIKIGELCRLAGDECSWRAIAAALCSRPVARLEKAWKRVDSQALGVIESWVHPGSDGECVGVHEPRVTPWGADVNSRIDLEAHGARVSGGEEAWNVGPMEKMRELFDGLRTAFALCPRKLMINGEEGEDDVKRMVTFWSDIAAGGGSRTGVASKLTRVDQFMSLSIAAEPPRRGFFEPYYWTRPPMSVQSSRSALVPLLFPESLPGIGFVDRGLLLAGRLNHDPHDPHVTHGMHAHLRPTHQSQLSGSDAFLGSGGVSYGGTIIPVYNGELLLVVQFGGESPSPSVPPSRSPSRPPSSVTDHGTVEKAMARAPSFRVKPGASQGLERKASAARRSSLPSISHRQSFIIPEPSSEPPLRVLVLAGSLDRLVNILVHGLQNISVSVADDNGEMALKEGKTRDLVVDHAEFAKVWWNSFRSFVTPLVFFELVRKIYVREQPRFSSPSTAEYLTVARVRSEVLETIREWICVGGGAQDALDDVQLFDAVSSFLSSSTDHSVGESSNFQDPAVQQAWNNLEQSRSSLALCFASQTKMPQRMSPKLSLAPARPRNVIQDASDVDRVSPEDFVAHLDAMACAAFSNVSEEDLFMTADFLEVQSADRISWLPNREMSWSDDTVEIQSIHAHLRQVEPSQLIPELGHDTLYRLLPPSIRSCIRAYGIVRKWLISKLIEAKLGIRVRQARMDLFLRSIEVARLRSTEATSCSRPLVDIPCTRSFVEAVLTSAVLSVESRMHQRAWQNLALGRGVQCDSLSSFLAKPCVQSTTSKGPLTVDMGWLIERILEIVTTPDIVESSSIEAPQSLVNFNKRRHLCNFILNAPSVNSAPKFHHRDDANRKAFERLNSIEKEVNRFQFDHRGIKEEAHREGMQAAANGSSSARRVARPFQRHVASQIEKHRRDKNLRDRLVKEKRLEDSRNVRREDQFNKAMRPRKAGDTSQKQRRNKKSMSLAFMHFMRPISSAFISETPLAPGIRRSPSELDFITSGKPSLVLSLVEARVAQFINNERSFTFQLDTEDGGHYLLQAVDKREMVKWMDTINRVANMAAKRRLTYLGNSPKPQPSDHIHNHPTTASRDPTAVFGVELEYLLQRESGGHDVPLGTVPSVIERCLSEVESRGLTEVGIYRIAGATTEVNVLREGFNRGKSPIEPSTDIHAVCDLVKSWFRVLPEPVFPASSYYEIIEAMNLENLDSRLAKIRGIVQNLPQANFDLLRRVSEHLDRVTDFEEHNQMTAEALAIVFSPNLMRAPHNDFVMILANMGHTHKLVKALITHFHVIFDEADPEAEMDQEDEEYDSPILEEDEDEDDEITRRVNPQIES